MIDMKMTDFKSSSFSSSGWWELIAEARIRTQQIVSFASQVLKTYVGSDKT